MINIRELSKNYGEKQVLKDINLDVNDGEIFAILGHNGAGKTTLIKCIMNLVEYKGKITYAFPKEDLFKNISLQMQSSVYEEGARVYEICNLYKKLLKSDVDLDELLDEFGLLSFKKSNINSLSGGEKQKLSILLTLINKPKVIIFDEITTGLDIVARRKVWSQIKKVNQEYGTNIILTSHFLDEVEYLADQVVILENGQVSLTGGVKDIVKQTYGNKKNISFKIPSVVPNLENDSFNLDFGNVVKNGDRYNVEYDTEDEIKVLEEVKRNNAIDIYIKDYSFEDAFLKNLGYVINEKGEITHE
ncbi:ABC transporter ATP-binding protein [Paucisalibacillus globulus]|uniref:ABC transporter ATP-binding protein n=1 Tax=Paucisalibacillus globulus TaxID=351095 RepID=UPI00041ADB01|nr:ABC transporter ATP-binding protein [Paucisalibacillus globulus]